MFLGAALLLAACERQGTIEEADDPWNGYLDYLKQGEIVHTLWAGRNMDVGTVTYGIDDQANFYVTYDCGTSGWVISETHMFAGDKSGLPLNKPGSPRIGRFPNSGTHTPPVSSFTYTVPLASLPPAEDPGFVVAAHCVVEGPSGQQETAWAEGDYSFTDKDWGWYDVYYYNQEQFPSTILYGTLETLDTLEVYFIHVEEDTSCLVFREYVGDNPGSYDGAAFDDVTCTFFFANYNTGELWVNQLQEEGPSICAGVLTGTPASGTFYDGYYFYVDADMNTINRVTFGSGWQITGIEVLSTIPSTLTVNDIAMNPSGTCLYILGDNSGAGSELICWQPANDSYLSTSLTLSEGAQIAYGSDGLLYVIDQQGDGTGMMVNMLLPETGVLVPLWDGVENNEDPFSDISSGRGM